MEMLSMAVSIAVLGILYKRMLGRELPEPITGAQAFVPIGLGVVSTVLSVPLFLGSAALLVNAGYVREAHPLWVQSAVSACITAGLPEELSKFLMILLGLLIFRKKIKNVYEYVLLGAAVGFGFTVFEEYLYASDLASLIFRLILIALHMLFSMAMAYFLGRAKYQRLTGKGAAGLSYVLAFLVPIAMHTIYDACTATNMYLRAEDDDTVMIGITIGVLGTVVMFVLQIIFLNRFKKSAEKLSLMKLIRQEPDCAGTDENMAEEAEKHGA